MFYGWSMKKLPTKFWSGSLFNNANWNNNLWLFSFTAPVCSSAHVYENRKEAFALMKKNKGARFKVFKTQQEAETFVNSEHDLSTPKRVEPVSRIGTMNVVSHSQTSHLLTLWTESALLRKISLLINPQLQWRLFLRKVLRRTLKGHQRKES